MSEPIDAISSSLPPLQELAEHGDARRITLAVRDMVNQPDAGGDMPLHVAAIYGRLEFAAKLIAFGADVNALSPDGVSGWVTPYDCAVINNNRGVAALLESAGGTSADLLLPALLELNLLDHLIDHHFGVVEVDVDPLE
jgi:ankyrin repeat protein